MKKSRSDDPKMGAAEREEELRQSETRLRTILETVVDGIVTVDERGTIESFNPAAEKIFGYRASDVIGRNISLLMPEPDRSQHNAYIANYLKTGEAKIISIGREVIGRRQDGSTFPLYLSISEMFLGKRRMFTGIIRDFTEFHQMQEEVLKARNLAVIGEMAASVAHEIKNPIAGISGVIQVIRDQMAAGDPHREIIEEVFNQIRRLDNTVHHLLMFARPWRPQKQTCDLRRLLESIAGTAREQNAFSKLRFEFQGERSPLAPVDPGLVELLVWNLLRNSADAMPGGGQIRFSLKSDRQFVTLLVSDDGPGIPEEIQEKLFRPFFSTKARGTGLGLAICKKIVEAHGGTIEISRHPGPGTTVRVNFPAAGEG